MIRLNGIQDKDLGIRVLKDYVDPQFETRDKVLQIPGMDGAYYFGNELAEKTFYFPIFLERQATKRDMLDKIRQLKEIFFDGYGKTKPVKLMFDDEPDRYYTVRYSGWMSIEKLATMGTFTMRLIAYDPYAYHTTNTNEITMGSDTSVMSEVLLGSVYEFEVNSPRTLQVHNFSYYNIKPTILIQGTCTNITLTANGKSFSYGAINNQTLVVDGEAFTVLLDGVNGLSSMTGDFIEFSEGYNGVQVTGTNLNVALTFKFKPRYL